MPTLRNGLRASNQVLKMLPLQVQQTATIRMFYLSEAHV